MTPMPHRLIFFLQAMFLHAFLLGQSIPSAPGASSIPPPGNSLGFERTVRRLTTPEKADGNRINALLYSTEQGLITGRIKDILFDEKQRLWIADTQGGLFRMSPHSLESFAVDSLDSRIMDLAWDAHQNLWMATFGDGLIRFDGTSFQQFIPTRKDSLPEARFFSLTPDSTGGIYASSHSGGVYHLDGDRLTRWGTEHGLADDRVVGVVAAEGAIWAAHWNAGISRIGRGISTFDEEALPPTNRQRYFLPDQLGHAFLLAKDGVWNLDLTGTSPQWSQLLDQEYGTVAVRSGENVYVGTSESGLFILGQEHKQISTKQGLPGDRIFALASDAFGNLWLGSHESGIQVLMPDLAREIGPEDGLPNDVINDLAFDAEGNTWISYSRNRLVRLDTAGDMHFPLLPSGQESNLLALHAAGKDLWVAAGNSGLLRLRDGQWHAFPYAQRIAGGARDLLDIHTVDDRVWCAGYGGLYTIEGDSLRRVFDPDHTKEYQGLIARVHADSRGNLWLPTAENGLWVVSREMLEGTRPVAPLQVVSDSIGFPMESLIMQDALETGKGWMWLTTERHGLIGFSMWNVWDGLDRGADHANVSPVPFTTADGLPSNHVNNVLMDRTGRVWATTQTALVCLTHNGQPRTTPFDGWHVQRMDASLGLEAYRFSFGRIRERTDGTIAFAANKSVAQMNPAALEAYRTRTAPEVYVDALAIQFDTLSWHRPETIAAYRQTPSVLQSFFKGYLHYPECTPWNLLPVSPVFSHDLNHLTLHLGATCWGNNASLEWRYRLSPEDTWSPYDANRSMTFSSLAPGQYSVEVQARSRTGESDVARFPLEIRKPFRQTWIFFGFVATAVVLSAFVFYRWRVRRLRKANAVLEIKVNERTMELQAEKKKSDDLLLNILPRSTAEELKEHGKAQTRNYESVTVLFSDFKGFTQLTETMDSRHLVQVLDRFFQAFDQASVRFGLEKIKTIGDAYMCACGIPSPVEMHAARMVAFGLEMLRITDALNRELEAAGMAPWPIRIGIHTGPVIAGVVGKNKFAYDVWGDTVNIAARMESSGEPGKVNVSAATAALTEAFFNLEDRGQVTAKNKGELEMYFVRGYSDSYARDTEKQLPNAAFSRVIRQNIRFEGHI